MRKLSLDEIKEIELNLLIEFDKLCKKNNLYYTLCGGTLLGAVRHKGFIPWDDDIDVLMPRPDYERLINNYNIDYDEFPSYIDIAHWKKGNLNFPFIKFTDSRTKIQVDYFDSETNVQEIWIDIFPIDGNPTDLHSLKKLYKKSIILRKILLLKLAKNGEGKNKLKRCFKPVLKKILSPIKIYNICQKIDEVAKTYDFNTSKYIGGVVWGYGIQERISKDLYLSPYKMKFENHHFYAPTNYKQYLSQIYGNYMQLPPENKRVIHGIHAYIEEEDN